MSTLTVYIKNMAGDVSPLEVDSSATKDDIALLLFHMEPELYPLQRTLVLRTWLEESSESESEGEEEEEEEHKSVDPPLMDGEVLSVFVMEEVRVETGRFPQGGKPYTRLLIPFEGMTLYLYVMGYRTCLRPDELTATYGASFSPQVTSPSHTFQAQSIYLFHTIRTLVPDVRPEQMTYLYDIVAPYYDERGRQEEVEYTHRYDPKEPILCACGSTIQRSSLPGHRKTKKHLLFCNA